MWESEVCERRDADGPTDSIWHLECVSVAHWWNFGFKVKSCYAVYKKGRCAVIEFVGVNELASHHNAGRRTRHQARRLLA